MELRDETRDGLRVFSVDSGRSTTRATLFFRVGQADETLATSGWTHLLEHMALHGWNDPRLAFNASVGLYLTRFDLDGEADAVLEHLSRLTQWLAEPDLSRLGHEAKVLRAESELRAVGTATANLEWRYGAQGPGLPAYREIGLTRATEPRLRNWCAEVFSADNAVLACDTVLPSDLTLSLPRGRRRPAALPPIAATSMPGVHRLGSGLVASAVVTRSFAAGLAPDVLVRTLTRAFRELEGTSYAPWADLERVDAENALILFGTDVSEDGRMQCGAILDRCLRELQECGPDQTMLDEMTVTRSRHFRDEQQAPAIAWAAALSSITDSDIHTWQEAEAHAARVTPEDMCEVFRQVRSTMVLGLPAETPVPEGFRELVSPRWAELDATSVHPHADGVSRVLVGPAGIQHASPAGAVTVRYADLAGLVCYPDGARRAISRDGWTVVVEPNLLRRGEAVTAALDANAPETVVLPHPARSAADIPVRPSLWWRTRRRTRAVLGGTLAAFAESTMGHWLLWIVVFMIGRALYAHFLSGR
jgi:zinc protease